MILSADEITLALFGQRLGEKHDEICEHTQTYLFEKSLEIVGTDTEIILDRGFWQREDRNQAREFYESRGGVRVKDIGILRERRSCRKIRENV